MAIGLHWEFLKQHDDGSSCLSMDACDYNRHEFHVDRDLIDTLPSSFARLLRGVESFHISLNNGHGFEADRDMTDILPSPFSRLLPVPDGVESFARLLRGVESFHISLQNGHGFEADRDMTDILPSPFSRLLPDGVESLPGSQQTYLLHSDQQCNEEKCAGKTLHLNNNWPFLTDPFWVSSPQCLNNFHLGVSYTCVDSKT